MLFWSLYQTWEQKLQSTLPDTVIINWRDGDHKVPFPQVRQGSGKSFSLETRVFVMENTLGVMITYGYWVQNGCFPPSTCQRQNVIFLLTLPHENLVGLLEVKPVKSWPLTSWLQHLGQSHSPCSPHIASSNSSKLPSECSYQLGVPAASAAGKLTLALGALWSPICPDWSMLVCPAISVFWWDQEKSLVPSLFSFFPCFKVRSDNL